MQVARTQLDSVTVMPVRALSPARRRALTRRRPIAQLVRTVDDHWVPWAHVPGIRHAVLTRRRASNRPILIIGIPRAGTSWIGAVLGSTNGSVYLREPLTQTTPPSTHGFGWVRDPGDASTEELASLTKNASDAFAGLPRFARRINPDRSQFTLRGRCDRVVVKEVNPLYLPILLEGREPIIVHVLRHPAAVAASWSALDWMHRAPWPPALQSQMTAHGVDEHDPWERHGAWQAALHLQVLAARTPAATVPFETLASAPMDGFEQLTTEIGLHLDEELRATVLELSGATAADGPFGVRRRSAERVGAWRTALTDAQVQSVHRGWQALDPPWYRAASEW